MVRGRIAALLIAALAVLALAAQAHAQASAEYGMAAGHSATVTTGVGKKVGRALDRMNKQTGAKLTNIRPSPMSDNRRQLEAKAGATPASIHIESTPDKATIYVDGAAIAFTPADLKMAQGVHKIEIAHAGFFTWKQELTLEHGTNPAVKAALENEYKSELKISIQQ